MENRGSFGSKLGVILATAGSAVGLGNVWRFPYMAGQNGGAAFILIYLVCILLLGLPGMLGEFIIGRHSAANAARAYRNLAGGKAWAFMGYMGVVTSMIILGFYAVIAGWCLQYLYASIMAQVQGDADFVVKYSGVLFRPDTSYLVDGGVHPLDPLRGGTRCAQWHREGLQDIDATPLRAVDSHRHRFLLTARGDEGRGVLVEA